MKFLVYFWRLSVLAFCFACFGIGGFLMRFTLLPVIRWTPGSERECHLRARRLIHSIFASLVALLRVTGVMRLTGDNIEALRDSRQKLVLANHPSYLDVVILLAAMPEAECVVKQGLWNSWYFGGVVRAVGYISNADSDRLVDDCAAALAKGSPMLIFPEGTRTVHGQSLQFQRGAARIALRSGAEILPVIISCDPPVWGKGFSLWAIAKQQFHINFEVKSPLRLQDLGWQGEPETLAARRLTKRLEAYFTSAIESHDRPAPGNQANDHRGVESGGPNAGGHRQRRTVIR
ncbi:MAG: 1-acyl-sn-glycerol-3-phosphate acyltransferase [Gammaproteobacteria bacterium]|nr:1-acyl-sn-glycerol-3-phosphate acyltransferase [Gammaproteobacteria bacterium]